jgi:hypothetical protein
LLGVGVSSFDHAAEVQRALFDELDEQKHRQLDAAADQIREKFGSAALNRGAGWYIVPSMNRSDDAPQMPRE